MENVISDLSKYAIAIAMAIYTLECFLSFRHTKEDDSNGIFIRQIIFMFLIHFCGFVAICLETGNPSYIIFYAVQQIMFFAVIALFYVIYPEANKLIVNNMCLLLAVGLVMITRISYDKSLKQFKIIAASFILALFIPFLMKKFRFLKNLSWIYGLAGILLLSVVLVFGAVTHGSKLSLTVAGFRFQPSEFVKILFVFFVASMFSTSKDFLQVVITTAAAGFHVIILVLSTDLGSALIFFVVYLVMLFVATRNYLYLLSGIIAGVGASIVAYQLFSHVRVRVLAWKDPFAYIDTAGYQIAQSLFAIGTGGWFGMGIYQGQPTAIPYVEADSIFSAIAEEMGILFALCLILVCVSCFIMFMNVSLRLKNDFYRYIAVGLSVAYIFQVFLTIGGGTRFIPLTGVTLPLVSYGGSSVLSTIISFAIIQGLYSIQENEQNEDREGSVAGYER